MANTNISGIPKIPIRISVLPMSLDNSMTPLEVIGKLNHKINELIDNVNKINDIMNDLSSYLEPIVLKYFSEYLEQIEQRIRMLGNSINDIDNKYDTKCYIIEEEIEALNDGLANAILELQEYSKNYTDSKLGLNKEYTDFKINQLSVELKQFIEDADVLPIICPVDHKLEDIQKVIDDVYYDITTLGTITAIQYDNLNLTAEEYDSKNITARIYDLDSYDILIGGGESDVEWGNILGTITRQTDLMELFDEKVDKVAGKGLSTNDFTNEDKSKLDNIINTIYPIGHIITNNGTNPTTYISGTTWQLYATGIKALYLDATAGTIVNEELPNIKGDIQDVNFRGSSAQAITKTGALSDSTKSNGNAIGCGSPNGDVIKSIVFDASKSSSVYKDGGSVKASGITVCAWIRTQ